MCLQNTIQLFSIKECITGKLVGNTHLGTNKNLEPIFINKNVFTGNFLTSNYFPWILIIDKSAEIMHGGEDKEGLVDKEVTERVNG